MLSRAFKVTRPLSQLVRMQPRFFSAEVAATQQQKGGYVDILDHNKAVGADVEFNEKKHGYVLTFPWNYPEIIRNFESKHSPMAESHYWHKFMMNTRSVVDFNNLFREFHQFCALPDQVGLDRICEPKLANYVGESLKRIHFHGLDVEMANLTVEQPSIRVLKTEVH